MATSKSDAGKSSGAKSVLSRKIIDVTEPGKTAPPTTSKAIIVSNRPILRRDPMVAPASEDKHDDITPVSRVAKTIKVSTIEPLKSDAKPEKSARPAAPTIDDLMAKKAAKVEPLVSKPANTLSPGEEEKVAKEVGIEAVTSIVRDPISPVQPAQTAVESDITEDEPAPVPVPAAETKPAEPKKVAEPAKPAEPAAPEKPVVPKVAPAAPAPEAPAPPAETTVDDMAAEDQLHDGQLAPNQAVDQAKHTADDEKTARAAEQEKIIAGGQYYLPINGRERRRSLRRVLLLLLLVLLLAAVWCDIVLDAGIVHVYGVHALTHFFKQ